MIQLGFSDMLNLAQTIGIAGTMILTLYFSKNRYKACQLNSKRRFHIQDILWSGLLSSAYFHFLSKLSICLNMNRWPYLVFFW